MAKRGRPKKVDTRMKNLNLTPTLTKMRDIKFNDDLFVPMSTGRKIDKLLSSEGGLMRGTNYAAVGDPGVGKSTVMLDIISDLHKKGKKVLFISGEMTSIDMYGYVKRYPKFGEIPILFMGEYVEYDPIQVIEKTLKQGFDIVLVDSMAEIVNGVVDYHGGTSKSAESKILNMFDSQNRGENDGNINTTFLIIQQVTKSNVFAGSNRFKHFITGMCYMKFDKVEGGRYIHFVKNRRGGDMDKLYFSLNSVNNVQWLHTAPLNEEF
jgi:DNA repair protein RadA/Sms